MLLWWSEQQLCDFNEPSKKGVWSAGTKQRVPSEPLITLANSNLCLEKPDCDIRLQLNPSACLRRAPLAEPGEEREERKVTGGENASDRKKD